MLRSSRRLIARAGGFLLLATMAVEVGAQEKMLSPAARTLMGLAVTPGADYTKAGRVKLVGLIAAYCREMLTIIPTNTPNENAWVQDEGQTTDLSKIRRLTSSLEWSRYRLRGTFADCIETTDKLTATHRRSDLANIVKYEAAHLISLAVNFNGDGDMQLYARRAGL